MAPALITGNWRKRSTSMGSCHRTRAQIILVEANSQSLADLMASVGTAARQPGVSVVSISWGFAEGQAVFASDEATYDSTFTTPGVTFVASTGDYGAADPEYPAFSPNVVAVGGTSLTLNADNSYKGETGWGYYSDTVGAFIGSGGGISLYEPEPAYQAGSSVHRQPDHARCFACCRSSYGSVDRRPVQLESKRSVRDRGGHELVGAGLGGVAGAGQSRPSGRG